ncbi:MAG: hypothetical protein WC184_00690 [Acidimicrobiia bacterium]
MSIERLSELSVSRPSDLGAVVLAGSAAVNLRGDDITSVVGGLAEGLWFIRRHNHTAAEPMTHPQNKTAYQRI